MIDRLYDGIDEWRDEKAADADYTEQRKANFTPAWEKREKALMFIERERDGVYRKLKNQARYRMEIGELFDIDYEIKNIKRSMVRREECDEAEAKAMFKGASKSQQSTIIREMLLEMPELADYTRIRECSVSEFYPQLRFLEHSAAIDTEEGGDYAA